MAFRVETRDLLKALQPIAHQLRLAQFFEHLLLSHCRLLLISLHSHFPIVVRLEPSFYASGGNVVRIRGSHPCVDTQLNPRAAEKMNSRKPRA
jgi:hypothetical protein